MPNIRVYENEEVYRKLYPYKEISNNPRREAFVNDIFFNTVRNNIEFICKSITRPSRYIYSKSNFVIIVPTGIEDFVLDDDMIKVTPNEFFYDTKKRSVSFKHEKFTSIFYIGRVYENDNFINNERTFINKLFLRKKYCIKFITYDYEKNTLNFVC